LKQRAVHSPKLCADFKIIAMPGPQSTRNINRAAKQNKRALEIVF
jgi:hypothetical protein